MKKQKIKLNETNKIRDPSCKLKRIKCRLGTKTVDDLNRIFGSLPEAPSWKYQTVDGQEVVLMSLSEDMIKQSADIADKINKTAKTNGLREWLKSTPAWRHAGFRGQLATALYFHGDFRAAFKYITVGEADDCDLKVGSLKCNVVTRANPYIGTDMNPKENYCLIAIARKPYPIYIATQCFDTNHIVIWGYATYEQVLTWPHQRFLMNDYYKLLSELEPIRNLANLVKLSNQIYAT
jgi:hypothetical protein